MVSPRLLIAYPAVIVPYLVLTYALGLTRWLPQAQWLGGLFPIVNLAALVIPLVLVIGGTVAQEIARSVWQLRIGAKKTQ